MCWWKPPSPFIFMDEGTHRPRPIKKHCQRHNGPEGWVHITRPQYTVHKSWTYYNFRIKIKNWLQNLNQTSASRLTLRLKSWPRFNFVTSNISSKILTKLQLQNLAWTSTSKSSKFWPKCSKSEQKLSFMTKPKLPNLQQTVANMILITNISNCNNLNKFWVGNFTRHGHINQVY